MAEAGPPAFTLRRGRDYRARKASRTDVESVVQRQQIFGWEETCQSEINMPGRVKQTVVKEAPGGGETEVKGRI